MSRLLKFSKCFNVAQYLWKYCLSVKQFGSGWDAEFLGVSSGSKLFAYDTIIVLGGIRVKYGIRRWPFKGGNPIYVLSLVCIMVFSVFMVYMFKLFIVYNPSSLLFFKILCVYVGVVPCVFFYLLYDFLFPILYIHYLRNSYYSLVVMTFSRVSDTRSSPEYIQFQRKLLCIVVPIKIK